MARFAIVENQGFGGLLIATVTHEEGRGRLGQIQLAESCLSRSVTCYSSIALRLRDNLPPQVDCANNYVQFNRGSLIEYLNHRGGRLSKGYFFGLVGGSSDKEIRTVWNQVMGEREHLDADSIAVNVIHESSIGTLKHMTRLLRQEGYAVVHNTLGTAGVVGNQQCKVLRGGKADEKIVIFINTSAGGEVGEAAYQQRIDALLAQILPSLAEDRLGIHEIEVSISSNQDQALDQLLKARVNAWKTQHFMPQQEA